jgi:hypothetical protein
VQCTPYPYGSWRSFAKYGSKIGIREARLFKTHSKRFGVSLAFTRYSAPQATCHPPLISLLPPSLLPAQKLGCLVETQPNSGKLKDHHSPRDMVSTPNQAPRSTYSVQNIRLMKSFPTRLLKFSSSHCQIPVEQPPNPASLLRTPYSVTP